MRVKGMSLMLILCLLCTGCKSIAGGLPFTTVKPTAASVPGPIVVEIDVSSDQPNPSWTLSARETSELKQHLQGLSPLATIPPDGGGLGYRGFLLHNLGHIAGIGTQLHVHNGIIVIVDQGHSNAFEDNHGLEHWLEKQAYAHGQGKIMKSVGK